MNGILYSDGKTYDVKLPSKISFEMPRKIATFQLLAHPRSKLAEVFFRAFVDEKHLIILVTNPKNSILIMDCLIYSYAAIDIVKISVEALLIRTVENV